MLTDQHHIQTSSSTHPPDTGDARSDRGSAGSDELAGDWHGFVCIKYRMFHGRSHAAYFFLRFLEMASITQIGDSSCNGVFGSLAAAGSSTLTGPVTCQESLSVAGQVNVSSGSITITGPTQPNLMIVGTGSMAAGRETGIVMSSYAYGGNPPIQFGAQGDGNFGDDFLVLQKPSGNAGNNNVALRMVIKAATGNVGFGGQGAPSAAVDVTGTVKASTSINLPNCSSFTGRYAELSQPAISTIYNGPTPFTNAILWQATANTVNGGTVTFNPTTTNTASGTALFSTIVNISANPWNNTGTATAVQVVGGKTISGDLRTVVFNVVQGVNLALGGATMTFAPAGIAVMCSIIGF